jgi:hypothetical protein
MTNQTATTDEPWTPHNRNLPKLVGVIILKTPTLLVRCGGELLKMRIKARQATRIFHDELISQGMDPTMALQLSELYRQGSDVGQFLRNLR